MLAAVAKERLKSPRAMDEPSSTDTVVNATEENLADGRATGFAFHDYTASALYETVKWALGLYRDRPVDFRQIVRTAMAQDWSWNRSATAYEALYRRVMGV